MLRPFLRLVRVLGTTLVLALLLAPPALASSVEELLSIPTLDAPEGWDNYFEGQLDAETKALRQQVAKAIEANRKAVANPLEGKRIRASGKGFVYTVYHAGDRSHTKADYLSWLDSAEPTIVASRDEEELFMWEIFKQISSHEGDPSSINTYDNQLLTIGPGFSANPNPGDTMR